MGSINENNEQEKYTLHFILHTSIQFHGYMYEKYQITYQLVKRQET